MRRIRCGLGVVVAENTSVRIGSRFPITQPVSVTLTLSVRLFKPLECEFIN